MKKIIAAVAVTLLALTGCSAGASEEPAPDKTTKLPTADPAAKEPQDEVLPFGKATNHNGVTISVRPLSRAVSSDAAAPAKTPYVRLEVMVKNGSQKQLDATAAVPNCSVGNGGKAAEGVFDAEEGVGTDDSRVLLKGQSAKLVHGCAVPKGEQDLQVSIAGEHSTVVWKGKIK
ncbi:hypothetical protein ACFPA8_12390 [Streptomyces ovatisporus]|uniref:DUF4352 domain-containing protein n=1 Tax=Streptomyces ovatisporus TaxID=1128682 RepID=A0ABV9A7G4_9ACTN